MRVRVRHSFATTVRNAGSAGLLSKSAGLLSKSASAGRRKSGALGAADPVEYPVVPAMASASAEVARDASPPRTASHPTLTHALEPRWRNACERRAPRWGRAAVSAWLGCRGGRGRFGALSTSRRSGRARCSTRSSSLPGRPLGAALQAERGAVFFTRRARLPAGAAAAGMCVGMLAGLLSKSANARSRHSGALGPQTPVGPARVSTSVARSCLAAKSSYHPQHACPPAGKKSPQRPLVRPLRAAGATLGPCCGMQLRRRGGRGRFGAVSTSRMLGRARCSTRSSSLPERPLGAALQAERCAVFFTRAWTCCSLAAQEARRAAEQERQEKAERCAWGRRPRGVPCSTCDGFRER